MPLKPELLAWRGRMEDVFPVPPPEVDLDFRAFFGGMGAYVRGQIFAVTTGEGPALKFAKYTQSELAAQAPDAHHLSWTKLYLIVPPYIYDDDAAYAEWIRLSIDDVLNAPPRKKQGSRR